MTAATANRATKTRKSRPLRANPRRQTLVEFERLLLEDIEAHARLLEWLTSLLHAHIVIREARESRPPAGRVHT